MHSIKITKKGLAWFKSGHPWVYRDDVIDDCRGTACLPSHGGRAPTSIDECVVNVVSESDKFLAKAFYNPHSRITLRIITRIDEPTDRPFWLRRIKEAVSYRESVVKATNAFRLVFSESDLLPGLIVDLYDDILVLQITSLGMELLKEDLRDILAGLFNPKAIVLRNDCPIRRLEGLAEEKKLLLGKRPGLTEVFEGDIKYLVDAWDGHKTGAYLDQRENRLITANIAGAGLYVRPKTSGLAPTRVLDAFCYHGGFSLHLAKIAGEVIALDSSLPALDIVKKNLELNRIKNVIPVNAKAFDKLKEFAGRGEKFDIIILDPPPFAKSKTQAKAAWRGYKELNLRAIQCLNKGGYLVTFSCSYNFSEEDFAGAIKEAAIDAGKGLRLISKLIQSKDHPISVTIPESHYLKGFVLSVQS